MNIYQTHENVLSVAPTNTITKQYNQIFGKKEVYTENEIFVFNAIRNAQKVLERDENKTT
jgi:hypothetical protein